MRKFFLGAALSATFIAGNVAPALANSTNVNTDGEVTAHSVEVNPDLIEIEGRTLTDAEAAEVEGEWVWVAVAAGLSLGEKYYSCQGSGQNCTWQDYAVAGAVGAVGGLIPGGRAAKNGARLLRRVFVP